MKTKNPPIFVVGVDRSGTTLLSMILDNHSKIAIPFESHFFIEYYNEYKNKYIEDNEERYLLLKKILSEPYVMNWEYTPETGQIDISRCNNLAEMIAGIYTEYARYFGKTIWGDKTPAYITDIHILNKMFPDSRFIHIIRDGRDVALSVLGQTWGANDFMSAIKRWGIKVESAHKMLNMLTEDRYLELKYEDLVKNPTEEVKRITRFLELDYEENMLEYSKKASEKVGDRVTKHHANLRIKPNIKYAFKWKKKLSEVDQAIAYELVGDTLTRFGYPSGRKKHALKIVKKGYHRLRESYEWRMKNR